MPIDASIPLQAKGLQLESPINQLAMLNEATKYGEMNRAIDTQNKLRELYSQGIDVGTPEGFKQVAAIDPKTAMALRNDALKGQELQGNIKKTGFEIDEKKLNIIRERSKDLLQNLSPENFIAHTQENVRDGLVTPEQGQRAIQNYIATPPNKRETLINQNLARAEKVYEMNTVSAAQQQTADITKRGQDIQAGTTRRGQDLQYAPDVVANTQVDSKGNITQFNRFGKVIGQLEGVGKPSATYEKTAALQKQMGKDIDLAISEIKNAIKPGGTLDKSTASGAGKMLDAAGNFIGYATSGSIAAAELKPVGDLALKMVPRFEGPQSDKDTASYTLAAGQLANENLPIKTRRAAAETVVRIMERRKGQFVNQAMASEGINAGGPALPPGFTPDK